MIQRFEDWIGRRVGLDRGRAAHGLRLATAALLAFAIAAFLHVGNTYWAAMPIWVVSQDERGLMFERAFYRVVGTLLGAGAGFAILHLTPTPLAMLVLLSIWVTVAATLVHVFRGVASYGVLMAGMTAAIVLIPSILQPGHAVALSVARVECTLIGVVVVTLVTGFWTPGSPRRQLYDQVRRLARDALAYAGYVLRGEPDAEADTRERTILRAMSEVKATAAFVTAGSFASRRRLHHLDRLVEASVATMAAARWSSLLRSGRSDGLPDTLERLAETVGAAAPGAHDQDALVAATIALDADIGNAVMDLLAAEQAMERDGLPAPAGAFAGRIRGVTPFLDMRLALESGLIAGVATFVTGILGLWSGWSAGGLTALGVCIFFMVLGSLPAPERIAPVLLSGVSAGVLAATVYRLTIQPWVVSDLQLVLSIVPFVLLGGLARASGRFAAPALDANMCFMLASQAALPVVSDRLAILNGAGALLLAAGLAAAGFMLLPRKSGRYVSNARKALQRQIRDAIAKGPAGGDRNARNTTAILRLSYRSGRLQPEPGESLLAMLNLQEAAASLHAIGMDADDGPSRQCASDALLALRGSEVDPPSTAHQLDALAETASNDPLKRVLRAASHLVAGRAAV